MAHGLGLRKIISQIGGILLQRVGSLILQISIVVFLAHVLGPTQFGQYAVATLLPGVLAVLLNLGIWSASVYALGRGASVHVVLRWNLRLGFGIVVCGVALSALLVAGASEHIFPGVPPQLLWIATCGFPVAWFYQSMTSVLHGKQDFRRYTLATLTNPAAALVAAILLVWAADLRASGAVAAWAGGQTCGLLLAAWCVWRHCTVEARNPRVDSEERPDLKYGLKAYLANLLAFLNYRLDILLVNFFVGPAEAGIYTVAVRVAEQLWLISNSAAVVLLPRLAGLHSAEETRRRLTPVIARWIILAGLGMAITLALISGWIVPLAFGAEFAQSAAVLMWLLPGVVAYMCVMVLSPDLAARGRPDLNGWAAGVSLAVSTVGNLLLIPVYGVVGAALASTLAYVMACVITIVYYTRLSHNRARDLLRVGRTDWEIVKVAMATVRGRRS
jgi:O-antigen/teichoic acid export membrane protein